jgi:hypothetical protein
MLVNYRTPEGIEAQCEGCCPSHGRSLRAGRRRAKQALRQTLRRRELRTYFKEIDRDR